MDDEEGIREIVRKILEHLQCEVRVAVHGDEAISLFCKAMDEGMPFDLVIIDLTINVGKGGLETLEGLSDIDPGVKAIVSSGRIDDPVMKDFQKFGFMGIMPKPYRIAEVKELLIKLIPGYQG
ncbi:MAG TPA: response regulator [Methanoregulaceae archaeon]|nr:response regulator [Methanoregulaceae archaeon]